MEVALPICFAVLLLSVLSWSPCFLESPFTELLPSAGGPYDGATVGRFTFIFDRYALALVDAATVFTGSPGIQSDIEYDFLAVDTLGAVAPLGGRTAILSTCCISLTIAGGSGATAGGVGTAVSGGDTLANRL